MGYDDFTAVIQLGVLFRIARAFWEKKLEEKIDRFPIEMHPRKGRPILCCVSRDREVIEARCLSALGLTEEEWPEEGHSLSHAVPKALSRTTIASPFLIVCDVACSSCIRSSYEITNACRNCVVRSCRTVCPRSAVQIVAGNRAEIDPDKCISCGMCQQVCPYHAIIRIPIPCEDACPVKAISKNDSGEVTIDWDLCIHCGKCMQACPFGAIFEKSEFLDVLQALEGDRPVVGLLAPAVVGQFADDFSSLRQQMMSLGFTDVLEVALGADAVAKEEGHEFMARMDEGERFMTTSCCPAYMEWVEKHAPQLKPFISHTPSPMRVVANMVKASTLEAITVFIGPCVAKRQEALTSKEVDYVLTFEELSAMLDAWSGDSIVEFQPPMQGAAKEGRQFAMSGGVAQSIQTLVGDRVEVKPVLVDGLTKKSIALLKSYAKKSCPGNFVEVMSCAGGCIAGPGAIVKPTMAAKKLKDLLKESPSLK